MSKTMFQIVAEEFAAAFTADNPRSVWSLKDASPQWMIDALREAHTDGRMPDDWHYENCKIMADMIAENDDASDIDIVEAADGLVDVYTGVLTAWLASNTLNVSACDEAIEEGLCAADADMGKRIQMGQYLLLDRACAALVSAIDTEARNRESDEAEARADSYTEGTES